MCLYFLSKNDNTSKFEKYLHTFLKYHKAEFRRCHIIRLKLSSMKLRFVKLYRITQDDRCCELFYRCSSRTKFAPMWIMKPRLLQFIFTSHVHFKDTMHYHAKSIQLSNDHEQPNAICLKEIRIFYHDAKLFLMLCY